MGNPKPYWYYRLKFSCAGRLFSALKYPSLKRIFKQSKQYYGAVYEKKTGLIFDIGANTGDITRVFLGIGNTVVACEPDAANFKILKARFNGHHSVRLVPAAVAETSGKAGLFTSPAHGGALSTLSIKRKEAIDGSKGTEGIIRFQLSALVETITLDDLIAAHGYPDFIKIDVEGYEQQVIAGLSEPVPLISFEANLPEFLTETICCIKYLSALSQLAVFNCSRNEQSLVFDDFLPADVFVQWLQNQSDRYFEIFCRSDGRG
jgi:FkbM family methyltransferase